MVKSLHQRVVLMSAKKKFSKGPTKNDFYPPNEVSDLDEMFPKMMRCWCSCCWWNESHDAQKSSQTEKSLSPPVHRYPRSLFQKRNERERRERNSTLSEIAISLSFSPLLFSLWLLFLWYKKTTQIVRKARTLATVRFLNWLETAENCVSWVVCCDEKKLFWTSVSRLLSSRWLRETRLIFATRVKGLIPTWVANLPATERKKKHQRARAHKRTRTVRNTSRAFTVKNERKFVPWQWKKPFF